MPGVSAMPTTSGYSHWLPAVGVGRAWSRSTAVPSPRPRRLLASHVNYTHAEAFGGLGSLTLSSSPRGSCQRCPSGVPRQKTEGEARKRVGSGEVPERELSPAEVAGKKPQSTW